MVLAISVKGPVAADNANYQHVFRLRILADTRRTVRELRHKHCLQVFCVVYKLSLIRKGDVVLLLEEREGVWSYPMAKGRIQINRHTLGS